MVTPKDYTNQEKLCAKILTSMGLRYQEQMEFGRFTVDFYLPEIDVVVEVDGPYGHVRKADRERDAILEEDSKIWKVLHVKSTTQAKMEEEIREGIAAEVVLAAMNEEYLEKPSYEEWQMGNGIDED